MPTTDQWGSQLPKGLGTDQEASQATAAMRQSPWYQDWAKQNGLQFEGNEFSNAKLNDNQQQQLYDMALKHGIGLNNKYDQIDENGQISEAHHKLRNTLIGLAIGGAAATGLGAAGIGPLSGMFGASSGIAAGAGADVAGASALGGGGVMAGLPGAMATLPGLGAGLGTGAAGAGSTMAGMLPSTQIGNGMIPAITGGTGSSVSAEAGGSFIDKLLGNMAGGGPNSNPLSTISSLLGSMKQGTANDRALEGLFSQNYDRNAIEAQTQANAARGSALKQLAQSNSLLNKPGGYTPTSIQLNGQSRQLPDYGFSLPPVSDAQRQGAGTLQTSALKTLAPGGTYTPQPLSNYATAGPGEKAANIGSGITSMLPSIGGILKMFGK